MVVAACLWLGVRDWCNHQSATFEKPLLTRAVPNCEVLRSVNRLPHDVGAHGLVQRPVLLLAVAAAVELNAAATTAVENLAICALLCAAVSAESDVVTACRSARGSFAEAGHGER